MRNLFDIAKKFRTVIFMVMVTFALTACPSKYGSEISPTQDSAASEENLRQQRECWQKEILAVVYNTISRTVMGMHSKLSKGAAPIMMIAFAIWFALRLMKFLSSVAEENSGAVWNEVIRKAFICLFCALLASSTGGLLYTMNMFIFPVYNSFLEFGSAIMSVATQDNSMSQLSSDTPNLVTQHVYLLNESIDISKHNLSCKMSTDPAMLNATASAFPSAPRDLMECMICALASRLTLGLKVALVIMSAGDGSATMTSILIGILIYACFAIVWLGFVFYLIDSVIKFGIMILMLPILIMAFAFKPTKKWTAIGFTNIMVSAVFLMAISIMITTALLAIVSLINGNPEIFNPANAEVEMKDFSVPMMCLMIIAFLIVGVLEVSQQLSSAIIGAKADANVQKKIKAVGGMVLDWVTGGVSKFLAPKMEKTKLGQLMKKGNVINAKLKNLAGKK